MDKKMTAPEVEEDLRDIFEAAKTQVGEHEARRIFLDVAGRPMLYGDYVVMGGNRDV